MLASALCAGMACSQEAPKQEAPAAKPAPAAPKPPPPPPAPAGDGGGDTAPKAKLGPAPTDGLTLAERMAKRKVDEDKLAAELAGQEKDRLLKYDKTKLGQHSALLAFIKKTRKALDDAAEKAKGKPDGKAAVQKVAEGQRKAIEAQGKVVKAIDPKGGNSNIVTDQDVSLNLLANDYPAALQGAMDGDEGGLKEQSAELDKRIKKMEEWLVEVKAAPKK